MSQNQTASELLRRLDLDEVMRAVVSLSADVDRQNALKMEGTNTVPLRDGGVLAIKVVDRREAVDSGHSENERNLSSLASVSVGSPPFEKIGSWTFNAHEKMTRLEKRRKEDFLDVRASESADNKTTYGGCIVAQQNGNLNVWVYISFSGGPAVVDEVVCHVLAEGLGLTTFAFPSDLLKLARYHLQDAVDCTLAPHQQPGEIA